MTLKYGDMTVVRRACFSRMPKTSSCSQVSDVVVIPGRNYTFRRNTPSEAGYQSTRETFEAADQDSEIAAGTEKFVRQRPTASGREIHNNV